MAQASQPVQKTICLFGLFGIRGGGLVTSPLGKNIFSSARDVQNGGDAEKVGLRRGLKEKARSRDLQPSLSFLQKTENRKLYNPLPLGIEEFGEKPFDLLGMVYIVLTIFYVLLNLFRLEGRIFLGQGLKAIQG